MKHGDLTEAVTDYEKELADYPNESNVSRLLAATLLQQQKPDDAISVLQASVDHNPGDEAMVHYLASVLTQRGNNAAAEKVLRSGIADRPDSLVLKARLGITLLHEQKNEEGESLLRDVLAKTDDPEQLNDAAYELADANLDLPLAEKSSTGSLDLLDQATNNGETGPVAVRRASLLVSAWDTFGWILYREGRIDEAEPWVRASWRNGNKAETGYHLPCSSKSRTIPPMPSPNSILPQTVSPQPTPLASPD